jgi:hypothetical protein
MKAVRILTVKYAAAREPMSLINLDHWTTDYYHQPNSLPQRIAPQQAIPEQLRNPHAPPHAVSQPHAD